MSSTRKPITKSVKGTSVPDTAARRRNGKPRTGTLPTWTERYQAVRDMTAGLSDPLSPEDCTVQSMPDASPIKWHLAHTSWFFETFLLAREVGGYRAFHPEFRVLFNSYYHTIGRQHPRPARGLLTRPSLSEVRSYRAHVDHHMTKLIERETHSGRLDADAELRHALELGLNHEQQHQELLLMDVKHLFSLNPLRPAYRPESARTASASSSSGMTNLEAHAPSRSEAWSRYPAGTRQIGHDGDGFAFDNEGPEHRVHVESFDLANRLVTNAEFLAFVESGGYEKPEHWLSDGWDAVLAESWTSPLYWERRDGTWSVMTLSGLRPLLPEEPVCHVSFYEADAFARWSGARLPTEQEWEVAARSAGSNWSSRGAGIPAEFGSGGFAGGFLESGRLHPAPSPVGATSNGRTRQSRQSRDGARERGSEPGPLQLFGDVWEWTQSAYAAYPGYRPPLGALGEYNGKFMCNQMVLRGGSCVTPASHMRVTYRNFFRPGSRWQLSGIRLARDAR